VAGDIADFSSFPRAVSAAFTDSTATGEGSASCMCGELSILAAESFAPPRKGWDH
jgi:hypothetical protein